MVITFKLCSDPCKYTYMCVYIKLQAQTQTLRRTNQRHTLNISQINFKAFAAEFCNRRNVYSCFEVKRLNDKLAIVK